MEQQELEFKQMTSMIEAFFLPCVTEETKFSYKEMSGYFGGDGGDNSKTMVCYYHTSQNKYEIKITLAAEEQEIEVEMGALIDATYYKIFSTAYLKSYSETLLFLNVLKTVYLN